MRVLLIEDEPTTAKSIELMLTSEGFNVYTTDLGEEGLISGSSTITTSSAWTSTCRTCTATTC
jgi:DNA-binding response OmpR family regulator